VITLDDADVDHAHAVGQARHALGGQSRDTRGHPDKIRADIVGAMGEMAVCRYYGADISQVKAYEDRPPITPDLTIDGKTICVKATEYWSGRIRAFVPVQDRSQYVMLVSVLYDEGLCGIRGWMPRADVLRYPIIHEHNRDVRHIPKEALHPCKATS